MHTRGTRRSGGHDNDTASGSRRSTRQRFFSCRVCLARVEDDDRLDCAHPDCRACVHRRCARVGSWVKRAENQGGGWLCPVCGLEDEGEEADRQPVGDEGIGEGEGGGGGAQQQPQPQQQEPQPQQQEPQPMPAAEAELPPFPTAATAPRTLMTHFRRLLEAVTASIFGARQTATTRMAEAADSTLGVAWEAVSLALQERDLTERVAASCRGASALQLRAAEAATASGASVELALSSAGCSPASAVGDVIRVASSEAAGTVAAATAAGAATAGGSNKRAAADVASTSRECDIGEVASKRARPACPICYQPVDPCGATRPEACEHEFCFDCLMQWCDRSGSCPLDRRPFDAVLVTVRADLPPVRLPLLPARVRQQQQQQQLHLEDAFLEAFDVCSICRVANRPGNGYEDMVVCDHCEAAYHVQCLGPERLHWLQDLDDGQAWFCPDCAGVHR